MRTPPTTSSRLKILENKLDGCTACPYGERSRRKIYYRTVGTRRPFTCLFVTGAPTMVDYIQHAPLSGEPRQLFESLLKDAFPPELCGGEVSYMVTNAILCTPFSDSTRGTLDKPPIGEAKKQCKKLWLPSLLKVIQPRYIISVGRVADSILSQLKIPHTHVTDPSAILMDKHFELESKRFVLTLQTMIGIDP
jgi:uracil-DNA glycosylase